MWDPYAEFEKHILDNGLTVFYQYWPRDWQKTGIIIHAGAKDDPPGKEGLAHFTEHMTVENMPISNFTETVRFAKKLGGDANFGCTNYSGIEYSLGLPLDGNCLENFLNVFGKMILANKAPRELEKQRSIILKEFNERYPIIGLYELSLVGERALFGDRPLGRILSALGEPGSINNIQIEDIEEFKSSKFVPANISIVSVGGMNQSDFLKILNQSPFGAAKKGERTRLPERFEPSQPAEIRQEFSINQFVREDREYDQLYTAAVPPLKFSDYVIVNAMNALYDTLWEEFREKRQWIYSLDSKRAEYPESSKAWVKLTYPKGFAHSGEEVFLEGIRKTISNDELVRETIDASIVRHRIIDINAGGIIGESLADLSIHHRILELAEIRNGNAAVKVEEVREFLDFFGAPQNRWTQIERG